MNCLFDSSDIGIMIKDRKSLNNCLSHWFVCISRWKCPACNRLDAKWCMMDGCCTWSRRIVAKASNRIFNVSPLHTTHPKSSGTKLFFCAVSPNLKLNLFLFKFRGQMEQTVMVTYECPGTSTYVIVTYI